MDAEDLLSHLHFRVDEMLCDAEADCASSEQHRLDLKELIDMVADFVDASRRFDVYVSMAEVDELEREISAPAGPEQGDPGDETRDDEPPLSQADGDGDPRAELNAAAVGVLAPPSAEIIDSLAMELMLLFHEENNAVDDVKKMGYRQQRLEAQWKALEMLLCFGAQADGCRHLLGREFMMSISDARLGVVAVRPLNKV